MGTPIKKVDKVLKENAYFAHPENIIIAMLTDPDDDTRVLGWKKVQEARKIRKEEQSRKKGKSKKKEDIRSFRVPPLNLDGEVYVDMVDWSACPLTEPPLTMDITDRELEQNVRTSRLFEDAKKFPCHTQGVERLIRLVSKASKSVVGQQAREGFIDATLKSRKEMPQLNTKTQYVASKT